MNHLRFLGFLFAVLGPGTVLGQVPPPRPLPATGAAPFLYIRIAGPAGMHALFYQGSIQGRDFPAPVAPGFRPGFIYRVELKNFPDHPGVTLYPTLEVRGTLRLPPNLRAADYPAPVVFKMEDIERVLAGSVLTKVVYLEDPDQALSEASHPDQPLEVEYRPGTDPLAEARSHGRPVLIVRLGQRTFTPEEMAEQSVPGTILLPGDTSLPPAARRPQLPPVCPMFFDPVLGPRPPEEECLHDGGDAGLPAGYDAEGRLQGVGPADTVAGYTDSQGRRHVAVSNRVCLCVPRFVVASSETLLGIYQGSVGLSGVQGRESQAGLHNRVLTSQAQQAESLLGFTGRERASGTVGNQGLAGLSRLEILRAYEMELGPGALLGTTGLVRLTQEQRTLLVREMELALQLNQPYAAPRGTEQVVGPSAVGQVAGVNVLALVQGARDLTQSCHDIPSPPDKPLVLFKWADHTAAQVGDVVTFFLKFTNHGGQPIADVAVSDSLTGRLEYVPGTARSNRDAVFTTQENEAGSVLLHWEVTGTLLPGQSGVVSFQARVR
ncbi:MAG: DUF11 domain-containing protein [Planctomycetes bacterium]|nr:DUF11 domain-containing protein [Planctomycetota bacterium]